MACQECGNTSDGIINGLCSSCTIKNYGCLFPWLPELEKKAEEKKAAQQSVHLTDGGLGDFEGDGITAIGR